MMNGSEADPAAELSPSRRTTGCESRTFHEPGLPHVARSRILEHSNELLTSKAQTSWKRADYGTGPPYYLDRLRILPPAVPCATDVLVTHIEIDYPGVPATAFDAAGESATTTFPDLRKVLSAAKRETTPP